MNVLSTAHATTARLDHGASISSNGSPNRSAKPMLARNDASAGHPAKLAAVIGAYRHRGGVRLR